MAEARRLLPSAAQRPGLALIAVDDLERASGTLAQQPGATTAHLAGVGPLVARIDSRAGCRGPDELLGGAAGSAMTAREVGVGGARLERATSCW